MRRVIYAWNYLEWGGAQIHFLALMKAARREFEVTVVLPKRTDPQFINFLKANGIQYLEFEPAVDLSPPGSVPARFTRRWRRIQSEREMIRTIRTVGTKDAIVHTDILPTQSLLSLVRLCARWHVFITSHNALPPVSSLRWRWMRAKFLAVSAFRTFHVFCTNRNAAEYFKRLYSKRVGDHIRLTYDSVDPEAIENVRNASFDRAQVLGRLSIDADRFVVLAVGQFIDRKGRWTFLDAARRVASEDKDIDFVWLTPSAPTEADRAKIAAFGLNGRFHIVPAQEFMGGREDVLRFFRIADVYALPSFLEGLPISLLEAMAMGLPSISTNVYGIPEAVRHEETGLLIEAGDSDALASAILRLKSDPDYGRRLAAAGRDHVLSAFDEREAAAIAVSEYRRVF